MRTLGIPSTHTWSRTRWCSTFGLATLFFWSAMVMFGGLLVETILLYPNIFHDVPASLERSSEFLVASNPGSYFPQLGAITLGSAVPAIIATWRRPFVRYTFLGGFLSIALGDFLLSMLAMWERNTILFQEGLARHSAEYLQQVAADFQVAHWFRVAAAGLAAALVFAGLLRLHREAHGVDACGRRPRQSGDLLTPVPAHPRRPLRRTPARPGSRRAASRRGH